MVFSLKKPPKSYRTARPKERLTQEVVEVLSSSLSPPTDGLLTQEVVEVLSSTRTPDIPINGLITQEVVEVVSREAAQAAVSRLTRLALALRYAVSVGSLMGYWPQSAFGTGLVRLRVVYIVIGASIAALHTATRPIFGNGATLVFIGLGGLGGCTLYVWG